MPLIVILLLPLCVHDFPSKKTQRLYSIVKCSTFPTSLSGAPLPPYVKAVVEKLKKAKEAIDAGDVDGAGAISWTDLIYLSGKVTSQAAWKESKVAFNLEDAHLLFLLSFCIPAFLHPHMRLVILTAC